MWQFAQWILVLCHGLILNGDISLASNPPSGDRVGRDVGLIGHWKLVVDARDYSGNENHGRYMTLAGHPGEPNALNTFVEVPNSERLKLGTGDFTVSVWIRTGAALDDAMGDLVNKYDPARRSGFNLTMSANGSGYNSSSNTRHLFFGTDNDTPGEWTDCGRPGGKSHSSDALTVFNGELYAGTTDGPSIEDWCHVYRYRGGTEWEDCGRVGSGRTRGVYALIVHDGSLYAATSASHGPQPATMDFGRVYRYRGGTGWEDLGEPGENYRLNSLATFNGKLYVTGFNIGSVPGHCYVYDGDGHWHVTGEFDGWPHTLAVHAGKLYTAYPKGEVFAFDGRTWDNLGNPFGSIDECNQIHSLGIYRGELFAGTWPKGRIATLRDGKWMDRGRPGDATEVIALAVYNGSFYTGTIPRAEVFRLDGSEWKSIRQLFAPPGFEPVPVGSKDWDRVSDWSRASSLTVFQGKLFASTGTCHRTMIDPPLADENRGKVYSYRTGECVSFDRELGFGWRCVVAVRHLGELQLFVDGELAAASKSDRTLLDLTNDAPLRIGFGEHARFGGTIRDVRLYDRALEADALRRLYESTRVNDVDRR